VTEDQERPLFYLVVVPVGESCYLKGHTLNRYPDGITFRDCELVTSQAMIDGIDPDQAIQAFRVWEPEP
jgi:hypothetical protein